MTRVNDLNLLENERSDTQFVSVFSIVVRQEPVQPSKSVRVEQVRLETGIISISCSLSSNSLQSDRVLRAGKFGVITQVVRAVFE